MTANGWAPPGLARRFFARLAAGNRAGPTTRPVPGPLSGPTTAPAGDRNGTGTTTVGEDPVVPVPETIICCACGGLLEDRSTARCWMAPEGWAVAADLACLIRLGERELGLTG